MKDIYVIIQFRWEKSKKLLKSHEKSSIMTTVHKNNTGAECFSAEKEQIDVLTAPDMGNASVGK